MDSDTRDKTEELNNFVAILVALPPAGEIFRQVFFRDYLKQAVSFLKIIFETKSRPELNEKFDPDYVLDELGIISQKKYNCMDAYELAQFTFSKKICELRRRNKNITRLLLLYKKINIELCKKIPNLNLVEVEYIIDDNKFKYFYLHNQPPSHIIVKLHYKFSLFRGNESWEELEKIHNKWYLPGEKLIDNSGVKHEYVYKGKTFWRGPNESLHLDDICAKINKIFIDNKVPQNLQRCLFEKEGWISPRCPWELYDDEKMHTNPIYKGGAEFGYDKKENPYTPVLYEFQISFCETFKKSENQIPIYKIPQKKIPEALQNLRMKPPNYDRSRLVRKNHCQKCKLFKYCGNCYCCDAGIECEYQECKCPNSFRDDSSGSDSSDDE